VKDPRRIRLQIGMEIIEGRINSSSSSDGVLRPVTKLQGDS
jgi:hypothetical protein